MENKDFEYDETKVDETEVLNRPDDIGNGGEPEPEDKATKVRVRPKEKAQRDLLSAVAKARKGGTVDAELSDEDAIGVVAPVLDALYDTYEEDGTVPTREAFAEHCGNDGFAGEVAGVVLAMERGPFVAKRIGGKAITAICAGCAVVAVLVGVGIWVAVGGQTQAAPDTGVSVSAPAGMYDDEGESQSKTETDAESDTETEEDTQAASDDGESSTDTSADEGAATDGGSDSESGSGGSTNSDSGSDSSTGGSTGGSNSGGSSSTPGGSGSGSSGGSGSSSPTAHVHSWVAQTTTVHHDAVYKTVHHDATYTTVHHDAVTGDRTICNNCGADITGNVDAHMKANVLNGCGSYSIKTVVVQAAWDEQVLASAAWDEQVLVSAAWDETVTTGYRCSGCGATK